jgi:hypothetical protein
MANLFTSQTPSSTNNSDGTPGITSGMTVSFDEDGDVHGVRIFTTTTVSGTYTGLFYQVTSSDPGTGTLLASEVYAGSTPTGGAWLDIVFDTPVAVTAGVAYRVGVHNDAGRYVATLDDFDAGKSNDGINAPAHNGTVGGFTVSQGVFRIDASPGYPNSPGGGGTNYFVDVDFRAPVAAVVPDGIAVPVAQGAPSTSAAITTTPGGIALAVALGEPSASAAVTASPDGIAAPVALGGPGSNAEISTAPAGISVPVTLGEPAIVSAVVPSGIALAVELGEPTVTRVDPTAGAGWGGLLGVINSARADAALNAERRRHPVDCPEHGWPLQRNGRGVLHCRFGGHIVKGS